MTQTQKKIRQAVLMVNRVPEVAGRRPVTVRGDWLSGAEAAAAVDDDALAGDEPGVVGGEEAHGVGDVAGGPHPPAGTDGEVGILDSAGTSAWRSTGMKPGATMFTVMPNGASSRAQLSVRPICALLAVA